MDFQDVGAIPIVDQGQQFIAGYSDDETLAWRGQLPVVVFGDHTRAIKFIDFPFILGADGVKVLLPCPELFPRFGYYYLRSISLPSARYSRHFSFLKRIKVPLAPLPEQERIVRILDAAEELRRLRAQADRRTADLIPALFYDMFGDPRFPGKQFNVSPLIDLCTNITDGVHQTPTYVDDGIPFLRVTDIQSSEIDWSSVKRITRREYETITQRVKPERGDILYSKNGTIGIAKEINWDNEFAHFVSLALLKLRREIVHPTHLTAFLNTPSALEQATAHSKTGTVTNLHLIEIKKIRVPVPPVDLQHAFVQKLGEIRALETRQAESRRRLDDLFQSLLHRAFQGEL